jgi:hypothetical protein
LLGRRYPAELIDQMMPGLEAMRDSMTYQAIVEEGLVGGRAELDSWCRRVLDVASWDELIATS